MIVITKSISLAERSMLPKRLRFSDTFPDPVKLLVTTKRKAPEAIPSEASELRW